MATASTAEHLTALAEVMAGFADTEVHVDERRRTASIPVSDRVRALIEAASRFEAAGISPADIAGAPSLARRRLPRAHRQRGSRSTHRRNGRTRDRLLRRAPRGCGPRRPVLPRHRHHDATESAPPVANPADHLLLDDPAGDVRPPVQLRVRRLHRGRGARLHRLPHPGGDDPDGTVQRRPDRYRNHPGHPEGLHRPVPLPAHEPCRRPVRTHIGRRHAGRDPGLGGHRGGVSARFPGQRRSTHAARRPGRIRVAGLRVQLGLRRHGPLYPGSRGRPAGHVPPHLSPGVRGPRHLLRWRTCRAGSSRSPPISP